MGSRRECPPWADKQGVMLSLLRRSSPGVGDCSLESRPRAAWTGLAPGVLEMASSSPAAFRVLCAQRAA